MSDLPERLTITRTFDPSADPPSYLVTAEAELDGNTIGTSVSAAADASTDVLVNAYVEAVRGMLKFTDSYREALSALGASAARRDGEPVNLRIGRVTE